MDHTTGIIKLEHQ